MAHGNYECCMICDASLCFDAQAKSKESLCPSCAINVYEETGLRVPGWEVIPLDELAALQGAKPVECAEELAADIWESTEELEAFLSDVYATR